MTQDAAKRGADQTERTEAPEAYVSPQLRVLGTLQELTGSGHGVTRDAQTTGNQRS